ncbi:hypothetical protein O0L34_g11175 [Tuta absoluta]|nr:hypothetical protein O0L34_g11175 [Tuta absoluta]
MTFCEEEDLTKVTLVLLEDYEEKYLTAVSLLTAAIRQKKPNEAKQASHSHDHPRTSTLTARLPKIKIKEFDGKDEKKAMALEATGMEKKSPITSGYGASTTRSGCTSLVIGQEQQDSCVAP